MTSEPVPPPPPGADAPRAYRARSDDSLRRLVALAARTLDMSGGSVSLWTGATIDRRVSTTGYDEARGELVAGLDATVAGSRRAVVVPDLAHHSHRTSAASGGSLSGAYLGVPLLSPSDSVTGVLHVLDPEIRPMVGRHSELLSAFGRAISDHLTLQGDAVTADLDAELNADVADVAEAIRAGDIAPWYQPIIDLGTGKIIGLEALARRTFPDGRIEGPDAFVPVAERSELIVDLDRAVAAVAFSDLKRWQKTHPELDLSVNLSGRHLDQGGWVTGFHDLATAAGVAPSTVHLEITETARPASSTFAGAQVQQARSLGFSVWLDDFGSGWSGLRDLLHLPVDGIKLDQSFANGLGGTADGVLIQGLTTVARALGLTVVIEGIETREQAVLAQELGCNYGQGFVWSAPVPRSDVANLLALLA